MKEITKRKFKNPNLSNDWVCPVCGTKAEEPVVLVEIPNTRQGNICQAEQVHADCYELVNKMNGVKVTFIDD